MGHGSGRRRDQGSPRLGRAGRDPVDRGGRCSLPLLHRRRRAIPRPRDIDGRPGGAGLRHRARVRRVHAVPRHPRLHRSLHGAHPPLARAVPELARRARPARAGGLRDRPGWGGARPAARVGRDRRGEPRDGIAIGGSLGQDKAQMYEVVDWTTAELERRAPQRPRHLLGIGDIDDLIAGRRARDRHVRLRDADAARPPRRRARPGPGDPLARRPGEGQSAPERRADPRRLPVPRLQRRLLAAPTCTTCCAPAS